MRVFLALGKMKDAMKKNNFNVKRGVVCQL